MKEKKHMRRISEHETIAIVKKKKYRNLSVKYCMCKFDPHY